MNFQQAPHLFLHEVSNLGNSSAMKSNMTKEEARCAQMTIFYDGKVIVFDDIPAEKVKDIMVFCTKGTTTSRNHSNNYASRFAQSHPSFLARNFANHSAQIPSTPVIHDLSITRKASLHRFLERRIDRIAARAPYQTSNPTNFNKPINEFMSWLSLAPQSVSPQDHESESSSSSVFL